MKQTIIVILILVGALGFISFVAGMATIGSERDLGHSGICEYKSFASIYNPFYRAGCELFEVRN